MSTAQTPVTNELPSVLMDVTAERQRQITKGWTTKHDDWHSTHELVTLAEKRLHSPGRPAAESGYYDRQRLIEGIAMLVAAVEAWDRRGADA